MCILQKQLFLKFEKIKNATRLVLSRQQHEIGMQNVLLMLINLLLFQRSKVQSIMMQANVHLTKCQNAYAFSIDMTA